MTAEPTTPATLAIDPLAPLLDGSYADDLVVVTALDPRPGPRPPQTARTEHFDLTSCGGRIVVGHRVPPELVDDDLAGLLADELFTPGWLRGAHLFEHLFTGVVRTSAPDPVASWLLFYRNTLARIEESLRSPAYGRHGTIDGYAPVYAHAESLVEPGTALELGSCFGFLALRLAASGVVVTASDLSAGAVRLLATIAPALGVGLTTITADASRHPGVDRSVDTVLAIHLLEHLDPEHGLRVLDEAVRLARRRVVIAVPLEDEADEVWGHVRTVSLDDLRGWGRRTGAVFDVHEHHGGWLVVDV